jgi:nicotinamidase-related amidase
VLIDAARLLGVSTFVTEQYPEGLGHTVPAIRAALDRFEPPIPVAAKTAFTALAAPEIARGLAASACTSVVVVGMESHVCVLQTARDLHARQLFVHVPFDAVASRDPACRATALELLAGNGVSVTTTETVVFDLLGDAKHPHFKTLSKLVRGLVAPTRPRE